MDKTGHKKTKGLERTKVEDRIKTMKEDKPDIRVRVDDREESKKRTREEDTMFITDRREGHKGRLLDLKDRRRERKR